MYEKFDFCQGMEYVREREEDSAKLFSSGLKVDDGVLIRRKVTTNGDSPSFISWFNDEIMGPFLELKGNESPVPSARCAILSGRAGRGKSTLLRKLAILLGRENKEPRRDLRPNFESSIENNLSEFIKPVRGRFHYIQLRKIKNCADYIKEIDSKATDDELNMKQFFIIDGLDEANDEGINFLRELITKFKRSYFLISARSYSNIDEVINLDELGSKLYIFSEGERKIGVLKKLSLSEKVQMIDVIKSEIGKD